MKQKSLSLPILLLVILSFFWTVPSLNAAASPLGAAVSAHVLPLKPPVKKQATKQKPAKKKHKKPRINDDARVVFIFSFPMLMLLGVLLFGIGAALPLFGLWLAGLILFGLFNVLMLALLIQSKLKDVFSDGLAMVILIIIFCVMALANLLIGTGFLIWGLIAGLQHIWITGAAALGMMLLYLSSIFLKS